MCDEECDVGQGRCDSPREVYFANVGTQGGSCVDMRVTNETEYRCAHERLTDPRAPAPSRDDGAGVGWTSNAYEKPCEKSSGNGDEDEADGAGVDWAEIEASNVQSGRKAYEYVKEYDKVT